MHKVTITKRVKEQKYVVEIGDKWCTPSQRLFALIHFKSLKAGEMMIHFWAVLQGVLLKNVKRSNCSRTEEVNNVILLFEGLHS